MASKTTRPEPAHGVGGWRRRDILAGVGALATAGVQVAFLGACTPGGSAPPARQGSRAAVATGVVRLLSVPTVSDGGEWSNLLPAFSRQTGIEVKVQIATNDLYDRARRGEADLVYSHYGHRDVSAFVLGGYGQWPRTILSNMITLLGPPADPAGVRGLGDLTEAFRRIAVSGATYEVNGGEGFKYLSRIMLAAGGLTAAGWYVDDGLREAQAVQRAAARGAYTLWGITPFLELVSQTPLNLAPLVTADPIVQRTMISIVVNPKRVHGVNEAGARALQDHLLAPATQARIRTYRHPRLGIPIFFPAGRDNEAAVLPAG